jgi:pyridoxine 5-phosphate synthase
MTRLSVNLNKIALLRNQRDVGLPDVLRAARTCMAAGAQGITVHPRPDERHIRDQDVYDLAKIVTVEFNIEGNPIPKFMDLVREIRPTQCTLVPDDPDQTTSDHGWDLEKDGARLVPIVRDLKDAGIRVSLFLDPDLRQIELAQQTGADRIELYTEPYARAFAQGRYEEVLSQYAECAKAAQSMGLGINAGHDLNLENLGVFLAEVPGVLEVSIGHALIAEALWLGLEETVKRYLEILNQA